ncbi:hypothetical protein A3780_20260 [Kosakonia radicincitans]|nr:hypothetical protein A3780_20260 [Kosakonia radicincitans]
MTEKISEGKYVPEVFFMDMRNPEDARNILRTLKSRVQQWCGKQTTNIMLGTTVMPVKDLNP